ncbi:MAG: metallophosphoesterase [Ferruginibacter sp.]
MHKAPLLKTFVIPALLLLSVAFHQNFLYGNHNKKIEVATIPNNKKDFPCFLTISDTHIDTTISQTKYGSETGLDLWQSAVQKINRLIEIHQPKFIILLGDLPWHAKKAIDSQLISARANTGFILTSMRALAEAAKIPLLYVPGNNDSWGGNYDAFTVQGKTPFSNDPAGQDQWPMINSRVLPADRDPAIADSSQLRLGCYAAYPLGKKSKLRLIVLNSVIFVNDQSYTGIAAADSRNEISWLKDQLRKLDSLDEFALIVMHVPPGKDSYLKSKGKDFWDAGLNYDDTTTIQDAFLDLTAEYQNRIIGILSSHTHLDGIKILTDRCNKFSTFLLSIPSIAPDHLNNPAIKIITYDPAQSFKLMNFVTYYNAFNENGQTSWNGSYSFDSLFKCPPATSIRSYIETKFSNTQMGILENYLQGIYAVKSSKIKNKDYDMDNAILVRYQKKQCRSR